MTRRSVLFGHAVSRLAKTALAALSLSATVLSVARASQPHGDCADPVVVGLAPGGGEIVWIDAGIETPDALIKALPVGTEVRILARGVDALGQIAACLEGRTELRALHLISHGAPGRLLLGGQWLDSAGMDARSGDLDRVRQALAPGADILLYGCDVGSGAEGRTFLRALAQATGADVAASSGLTGAGDLGGDWNLETHEGGIEARTLWSGTAGPDYRHVLAAVLLDNAWLANGTDDWTSSDNQAGGDLVGTAGSIYFDVDTNAFNTPPVQFTISSVSATPFRLGSISVRPFNTNNDFQLEILPNGSEVGKVTSTYISSQANETIVVTTNLNSITSFIVRFVDVSAGGFEGSPVDFDFLSMDISPVDSTPPTLAISLSDTALRAGETSLVTFTFSEPVVGFANGDITVPNGTLTAVSSSDGDTTWTATFTPTQAVTDASNVISVDMTALADTGGNPGVGTTSSGNFSIDTQRPTATIVVGDTALAASETSLVTFTFSEAVTGFTAGDLTVANGVVSALSSSDGGITWTATLSPTAGVTDASNLITLANTGVTDAAGNTGTGTTDSNNYAIDTQRPTATIVVADTNLLASETSLVTVTFSEAVSGFTNADLTIDNGVLSAISSSDGGIVWTATLTPATDTIDASNLITLDNTGVVDAAGNTGTGTTDSNNYAIHTVRPTVSITLSDYALIVGETATATFTFSEAVTGFTNADITVPNGTLSAVASSDGGVTWTATFTPTAGVEDATNVIGVDNTGYVNTAGNTGTGATGTINFTIDTLAPAAPLTPDLTAGSDSGASSTDNITSDTTPTLVGAAEANSTVEVLSGGSTSLGTTTADGSGNWSLTVGSALAEGGHAITARATDDAGNTGVASAALALQIDTAAPAIGTQPVGGTFVAGDAFTLSVAATDATALVYQWSLDGAPLSDSAKRIGSTTTTLAHSDIETIGFHGSYTVVVTDLAGNSSTSTAAVVTVNKADQTITFPAISDKLTTAAPFTVSATASSGLPVAFTIESGPATVSGALVTITGAGTVTIRATQAGDANRNAATADRTFAVTKDTATVTLGGLSRTYDGSAKSATATTTPASLTVNFTYDTSATAPTDAGSYAVVATVDDATYAGSVSGTLTIEKADQTVAFTPVGSVTVGTPVTLSATASSGLAVSYSVVSGDASLTGDQLTVNSAAGTVTVRATQSGNGNYNTVSSDQSITSTDITRLSQAITFAQPGDKLTTDSAFALSATASSGLTVAFAVQSGPATVSGNTVTLTGVPGTVTVVASQAGDGAYDAAPSITRIFAITAPAPLVGFGPVSDGAQERGQSAVWLAADGSGAVLIGFIPGQGGFVLQFTPDAHTGAFSATTEVLTTTPGQPATTWTFAGQVQGGSVSGTIAELGYAFAVVFDPATGPTAAIAGYYVAAALDTTTGKVHSIVGTTGTIYVLAVLPDLIDGIKTTVDGTSGDYAGLAASGVATDGVVTAGTESIDGALVRTGGGLITDYAGLRINTVHTDRLINLSSRARVGPGEEVLITGFHIGGAQPREVLLRAVGPGLDRFGVGGTLSDPRLALMQGNSVLDQNDDWGQAPNAGAIAAAFGTTGAFNLSPTSRDAAMLVTLPPGTYTVVVSGADGPGVSLAEIYDATTTVDAERLVNISARGYVGTGDDILIGGFIVSGNAPKRILVRGVGPSLARYGVASTLADPVLVVRQGDTVLAQNDDWGTGANTAAELAAAATATSAFALNADSKDSAILLTLAPGSYTAQVSGAAGANGIALVEVYELP